MVEVAYRIFVIWGSIREEPLTCRTVCRIIGDTMKSVRFALRATHSFGGIFVRVVLDARVAGVVRVHYEDNRLHAAFAIVVGGEGTATRTKING